MIEAHDSASMKDAETQAQHLLRQRHHLSTDQDDDFTVRNLEELFMAQEASAEVMSILLASIASVSLIVGGIGIMNIMLVSVTERTKEIGLRMAVGAKTKNILTQFLVEAVTLAVFGGMLGIAAGIGAPALISHFAGWTTHTGMNAIVIAFCFSGLVGIFLGYYPARKAALLNPIEALRYE
jgi:putative ABC transport system permease protein